MRIADRHYDVIVLGGGLAGFAAARTCARAGLETLIVERRPVLGWESTWAFQLDYTPGDSETAKSLAAMMEAKGGLRKGRLDAPMLELVLDREASESNIAVLYYSQPVAVATEGETMSGVVIGSKSGEFTLRGKAFVDATENSLLWQLQGTRMELPSGGTRFVLFLNGAGQLTEPKEVGTLAGAQNVVLKPGVWAGEVAVEFDIPCCDIRPARRALPELLKSLREAWPECRDALVTHVAVEPIPVAAPPSPAPPDFRHPHILNLFSAGMRAADTPSPRPSPPKGEGRPGANSAACSISSSPPRGEGRVRGSGSVFSQRLDLGEVVGSAVVERFAGLPKPSEAATPTQSVTAPPVYSSEVLVCGGGTAGALAAIAAAREGAQTTLLEASTFLGGIGSGGGIHIYYHGVTGGLQDEVDERVREMTPLFGPASKVQGFHPEVKKVVLQQMADEADVNLVFDTTVTGVEMEDIATDLPALGVGRAKRRIRGVVTASPEGGATYRAEVVVDSSGDADVAFMAGAPFTHGRDTDNLTHAYSQASGRLDKEGRLLVVNFDAGYCDPTDVEDLTRARRHGLTHYWKDRFSEADRLVYIAPLLGLRNSRQIVGDYRLTLSDQIMGRQFPDVIAYSKSHYDNHAYDYENESDEAMLWVWLLGNWHTPIGSEIPYRCLLPQDVEGLLIACRAISITHDAHNQLRMQRDMQRLGEVAGVAAAMSVRQKRVPRELSVEELQSKLLQVGALGSRQQPELPEHIEPDLHESTWAPPTLPALPAQQWVEQLGGNDSRNAIVQVWRSGEEALPLLLAATKDENEETRYWASVALAVMQRTEAVPALVERVRARHDDTPKDIKAAPTWRPAIVLLGRIGDSTATPALVDTLNDPSVDIDALIAVVRALGRIGDTQASPAIEELLSRDDLPSTRVLQKSTNASDDVVEDARWQLELAAAESLARLGSPRMQIVQPYLDDPRAYVRRYARKVAGLAQAPAGGATMVVEKG